jgi:hypothetical protein
VHAAARRAADSGPDSHGKRSPGVGFLQKTGPSCLPNRRIASVGPKPEDNTTGRSGLIFRISRSAVSPPINGILRSSSTSRRLSSKERSTFSPSAPSEAVTTS